MNSFHTNHLPILRRFLLLLISLVLTVYNYFPFAWTIVFSVSRKKIIMYTEESLHRTPRFSAPELLYYIETTMFFLWSSDISSTFTIPYFPCFKIVTLISALISVGSSMHQRKWQVIRWFFRKHFSSYKNWRRCRAFSRETRSYFSFAQSVLYKCTHLHSTNKWIIQICAQNACVGFYEFFKVFKLQAQRII